MLYRFCLLIFRAIWPFIFRWHYTGVEHVPATGPGLICANHRTWVDPVALGLACPRQLYFMAKSELFRFPPLKWLLPMVGAFPVRRGEPDRAALRHGFQLLADGKLLGMFPEGTRSSDGRLRRAEPGAALLAVKSGAVMVPAAIIGDYRLGSALTVKFGRPIRLAPPPEGRTGSAWLADQSMQVMDHIRRLMEDGEAAE
ncbi:MAG TPA: lysophospholipid acyltransferase family protein [Bacillota bacterium]|nr:lysophospholipid acyltransferase family protein [Bacillota bacterium]